MVSANHDTLKDYHGLYKPRYRARANSYLRGGIKDIWGAGKEFFLLALGHPPLGLRYDFPLALVRFGHSLLMCRIFNKNFLSVQSMSLNQENSNILLINSNAKTRLESSNKTFNLLIESI
jgi:hypothetical protein